MLGQKNQRETSMKKKIQFSIHGKNQMKKQLWNIFTMSREGVVYLFFSVCYSRIITVFEIMVNIIF